MVYTSGMARKAGQGSKWITKVKRFAIYMRDSFQCQYCGRDLSTADKSEVGLDHLVCSSHGGSNSESNLITVCRTCNSSRGTRAWRDYAPGGAQERIMRQTALPLNIGLARSVLAGEQFGS